ENLDALVEFLDLDGNVLGAVDDFFAGGTEELTVEIPADGVYVLRVTSVEGSAGSFDLSLLGE
ncbi:MAG: hypothetical protein AB1791_14095, partial [Chloroflexota bacterium]